MQQFKVLLRPLRVARRCRNDGTDRFVEIAG
ncbi:hypothetical protein ILFOPFJJ_01397 [Ensifer psoraleae]|nr:hypothetical protein [Sinorhizobium psoraleae]